MHPIGLAFYAALGDYFKEQECEIEGRINYSIRSIPYLQRMGLFSALGFKREVIDINEHEESGRFIPLKKIYTNADLNKFIKEIDPILHTTRENSRSIKHVFSEILRNVIEHAYPKYGANVCATYNRKRKKISIGISDAGIGLAESLRESHHIKDDKEAIIKALTPGITGKTKRLGGTAENAGAGLFFTKGIAQSTRNHFIIYSNSAYYKLLSTPKGSRLSYNPNPEMDRAKIRTDLPKFQGTLVGIDINIDDNESFNNLIENIGQAYKISVKKSQTDYYKRIKFI
jgi:anti-sigma regulatory factor (Ser/Thr protein kinase)